MPYWRLFYHVVWGTKHRLQLIDPAWEKDLYGTIWSKAAALECIPYAIGGMPDHLHVVIAIPPKLSVAAVVGQLKDASCQHVNEKHAGGFFLWQSEYGIFSVSEKALFSVVDYVEHQKRHHALNLLNLPLEKIPTDGLKFS